MFVNTLLSEAALWGSDWWVGSSHCQQILELDEITVGDITHVEETCFKKRERGKDRDRIRERERKTGTEKEKEIEKDRDRKRERETEREMK
jgi:hypothetical protein